MKPSKTRSRKLKLKKTRKLKPNKIRKLINYRRMRGGSTMDFLNNNNVELLHATKEGALDSILDSGKLMTNIERKEKGITEEGEGNLKRTLCSPYYVEEIPKKCSETYGVYTRLFMYGTKFFNTHYPPYKQEQNYCGLVFSPSCLDGTMWHINTCENNGFVILNGEAEYGDCDTPSFTIAPQQVKDILPDKVNKQIKPIEILTPELYSEVKESTEVILLNSIDLKHLKKIYFMKPDHMEKHKAKLDKLNIEYELTN